MIKFYCGYNQIPWCRIHHLSSSLISSSYKTSSRLGAYFHHLTLLNFSPALSILWIHELCRPICLIMKVSLQSDVVHVRLSTCNYINSYTLDQSCSKSSAFEISNQFISIQCNSHEITLARPLETLNYHCILDHVHQKSIFYVI